MGGLSSATVFFPNICFVFYIFYFVAGLATNIRRIRIYRGQDNKVQKLLAKLIENEISTHEFYYICNHASAILFAIICILSCEIFVVFCLVFLIVGVYVHFLLIFKMAEEFVYPSPPFKVVPRAPSPKTCNVVPRAPSPKTCNVVERAPSPKTSKNSIKEKIDKFVKDIEDPLLMSFINVIMCCIPICSTSFLLHSVIKRPVEAAIMIYGFGTVSVTFIVMLVFIALPHKSAVSYSRKNMVKQMGTILEDFVFDFALLLGLSFIIVLCVSAEVARTPATLCLIMCSVITLFIKFNKISSDMTQQCLIQNAVELCIEREEKEKLTPASQTEAIEQLTPTTQTETKEQLTTTSQTETKEQLTTTTQTESEEQSTTTTQTEAKEQSTTTTQTEAKEQSTTTTQTEAKEQLTTTTQTEAIEQLTTTTQTEVNLASFSRDLTNSRENSETSSIQEVNSGGVLESKVPTSQLENQNVLISGNNIDTSLSQEQPNMQDSKDSVEIPLWFSSYMNHIKELCNVIASKIDSKFEEVTTKSEESSTKKRLMQLEDYRTPPENKYFERLSTSKQEPQNFLKLHMREIVTLKEKMNKKKESEIQNANDDDGKSDEYTDSESYNSDSYTDSESYSESEGNENDNVKEDNIEVSNENDNKDNKLEAEVEKNQNNGCNSDDNKKIMEENLLEDACEHNNDIEKICDENSDSDSSCSGKIENDDNYNSLSKNIYDNNAAYKNDDKPIYDNADKEEFTIIESGHIQDDKEATPRNAEVEHEQEKDNASEILETSQTTSIPSSDTDESFELIEECDVPLI